MQCPRITMLLIAFSISVQSSFAQKLFFTDTSNKWYISSYFSEPGGIPGGPTDLWSACDDHFYFTQSVVFKGETYLVLNEYGYCSSYLGGPFSHTSADSALIREDTAAGKVYARVLKLQSSYTTDTSEVILFDYALQVGDTFTMRNVLGNFRHYVDTVGFTMINNVPHKTFLLRDVLSPQSNYYTVVEGLGTLYGVLFPYQPIDPISGGWYLKCFSNKDVGLVTNNPAWYFNCTLDIGSMPEKPLAEIYPNPANEYLAIKFERSLDHATIAIFDLSGRLISKTPVSGRGWRIDIRSLAPGIYLIKMVCEGSSRSFRFFKR